MSNVLIVLGLLAVIVGVSTRPSKKGAEPQPVTPRFKSNDKRIVELSDGSFAIEYFYEHPDWHPLGSGFKTPEEAKARLLAIDAPRLNKVVEVFPRAR